MPRLALLALLPISWALSCCSKADTDARPLIAVIPKGTTHEFWKAIHAGALKAGRELGVRIDWKSALKEDDREGQLRVVEDAVNKKVAGIVLAPLDDQALVRPVHDAAAAKIPVVVIDSGLKGEDHVSYVATDNEKGGVLAAKALGSLLGGTGRVLVLRYQQGSASTELRESGFLQTLRREFPGVEIVSDNQYGGATLDPAMQAAENLLVKFRDKVEGIFCPNETTTMGMLVALRNAKLAGRVKFVGFDSSTKLIEALDQGEIHGLVVQNPFKMGEIGVTTVVKHLRGEKIEKVYDTGARLATKANMREPEVKALLTPDLSELGRQ